MVRLALLVVLAGGLALAGCGDNLAPELALADLEERAAEAKCERFVRCGVFASEASCDGFFRARPDIHLYAALAAGIVRYDAVAAARCQDERAALPCDESSREVRVESAACDAMFTGTLDAGETCALDEECRSGACDVPACGEKCCTGTCRAARASIALGEACELDDDCVPDTFCGEAGACEALGGDGARCESDRQCDYGLGCIGATELMPGNCRALGRLGEACLYLRCADLGTECKGGTCVARGLAGASCTADADCALSAQCDATTNRCVAVPRLGDPCTRGCAGEAFCDFAVTGTCVAPRGNGEACGSDDQCRSLDCIEGPVFDICAERELCF